MNAAPTRTRRIAPTALSAPVAAALLLLIAAPAALAAPKKRGPLKPKDPPVPEWWTESMRTRDERVAWLKEAKFGMFVHWGVCSALGGEFRGKSVRGYSEHIMASLKIPRETYRTEIANKFDPVDFDAEAWMQIAQDAGMRYFVITAKHHDGFAMWPSEVSPYNIAKETPWGRRTGRDPMAELAAAAKKRGIRFGFYYSHAQDWEHPNASKNNWDYPENPHSKFWHEFPEWQHHIPKLRKYYDEKSIPQTVELIRRYDPDIMWFDTASWSPLAENLRVLEAARKAKPDLVVSSRIMASARLWGDYKSTNDRPVDFPPNDLDVWEGIPTTNNSYGYHKTDKSHKSPEFFIRLLAKATEAGGGLLMNCGPRGDGKIDEPDAAIFKKVGDWLKINGEAIYGTERSGLPKQPWGHVTKKGNRLYLMVFDWPEDGVIEVGGLKEGPDGGPVSILSSDGTQISTANWDYLDSTKVLSIRMKKRPDLHHAAAVIVLDYDERAATAGGVSYSHAIEGAPALISHRVPTQRLHVFDAELQGRGCVSAAGNPKDNYAKGWKKLNQSFVWRTQVATGGEFEVALIANAFPNMGGSFVITFGDQELSGEIAGEKPNDPRNLDYTPRALGKLTLPAGPCEVVLSAKEISGAELMLPTAIILRPVRP